MTTDATLTAQLADSFGLFGPFIPLTGGRVNKVWRVGDVVVKLYAQDGATPLFDNDAALEFHALGVLRGTGLAPKPLQFEQTQFGAAVTYEYLKGTTKAIPVEEIAELLGRLHAMPVPDGMPDLAIGADIAKQAGALGVHASAPQNPDSLCLVHRDPVPGNIISTATHLALIDWQTPGLGDPLEDIAHFLSPAMQVLYGTGPLSAQKTQAFLDAYPNRQATERYLQFGHAFHARLLGYCNWQVQRGNNDYAQAAQAEANFLQSLKTDAKTGTLLTDKHSSFV